MKISITVVCTALVLSGIIFIPNAFAENVPSWIKNNAGWWADGQIDDGSFVSGMQWLISNDVMVIPPTEHGVGDGNNVIPSWIKNNAGWWAGGLIDDSTFISGIQWLISNGIITLEDECIFHGNEYVHLTKQARFVLCNPDIDLDYIHTWIKPEVDNFNNKADELKLNSEGFRGPEFSKQKPDNTYRIIAIGGSTTWGDGVADGHTWPEYLQKKFGQTNLEINVEVTNVGIGGSSSVAETALIKERMIDYEPDLFLVYDGVNDVSHIKDDEDGTKWKDRWIEVCNLGKSLGFDTIITVHPVLGTGTNNFLNSDQEEYYLKYFRIMHEPVLHGYPVLVKQLPELEKHCTNTADLTSIFDLPNAVFFDTQHVGAKGNQIVADHMYELALPVIIEKYGLASDSIQVIADEKPTSKAKQDVPPSLDFRGKHLQGNDFSGQDLRGATFLYSTLDNVDFSNADLQDADLRFATISNTNFHLANLKDTVLSRATILNSDLSNVDSSGANLTLANIDTVNLTGTILRDTNLTGADLSGSDLFKAILKGVDLTGANLSGQDLSGYDLTDVILSGADLTGANITNLKLTKIDLTHANLSGQDLSKRDLSQTILVGADLSGANLRNTNLSGADLSNANLSGTDCLGASFSHAKLSGANLSDAIMSANNLWKADLSGLDFTVISGASIQGSVFIEANLSNSNFEGVNMANQKQYFHVLKNAAPKYTDDPSSLTEEEHVQIVKKLPSGKIGGVHILIISTEVLGNDLGVTYIFFNTFVRANLENVNFKNTELFYANFYLANLTNADLSGADLRETFLAGADLSNANLSGADLTGAFIDESAILTCKNHRICHDINAIG